MSGGSGTQEFVACEQEHHLPASAYTSLDVFECERRRVFAGRWAWVGFEHWVPGPGWSVPVTLAGAPLLLVRDHTSTLRTFHNVCRHRGFQLCDAATRGALRCPYHAWTYDLEGRLTGAPYWDRTRGSAPPVDAAERLGLIPVRTATWAGMVFVNLDGAAGPIEGQLGAVARRLSAFDLSRLLVAGERRFEVAANWKLAVEKFIDGYHLPWVHPGLGSPSVCFSVHDLVVTEDVLGTRYPLGNVGKERKTANPLPTFGDVPIADREWQELYWIAPNLLLMAQSDHVWMIGLQPLAPGRTVEHLAVFVDHEAGADRFASERAQIAEVLFAINEEDIPVLQRLQAGRLSPAADCSTFAPHWDGIVSRFHRRIGEFLAGGQ